MGIVTQGRFISKNTIHIDPARSSYLDIRITPPKRCYSIDVLFFVPASVGAARRAAVKAWERVRVKGGERKASLDAHTAYRQYQQTTWVVEKEGKGNVLPLLLLEV